MILATNSGRNTSTRRNPTADKGNCQYNTKDVTKSTKKKNNENLLKGQDNQELGHAYTVTKHQRQKKLFPSSRILITSR